MTEAEFLSAAMARMVAPGGMTLGAYRLTAANVLRLARLLWAELLMLRRVGCEDEFEFVAMASIHMPVVYDAIGWSDETAARYALGAVRQAQARWQVLSDDLRLVAQMERARSS